MGERAAAARRPSRASTASSLASSGRPRELAVVWTSSRTISRPRASTNSSRAQGADRARTDGPMQIVSMQSVKELLASESHAGFVRCCSLWEVMAGFGAVLSGNAVLSDKVHRENSRPAEKLDAFLSHSWHQPRWRKFLAIALVYHLQPAIGAGVLGAWLGFLLHWTELLPTPEFYSGRQGFASAPLGCFMFVLVFFGWGELRRLRLDSFAHPRVFLDRFCINQENLAEKEKGIKALGATIARSKRMVVLHSPSYFRRLWTVYEIACFMSVHRLRCLTLIPEFLPRVVLICHLAIFIALSIYKLITYAPLLDIMHSSSLILAPLALSSIIIFSIAVVVVRRWAFHMKHLEDSLTMFHIQQTQCFSEQDRPLVYGHVAALEKMCGMVDEQSSDEDALGSFNFRVQRNLGPAIRQRLGLGLPYEYVATMLSVFVFRAYDILVGALRDELGTRAAILYFLSDHVDALITYPLLGGMLLSLTQHCLHLEPNTAGEWIYQVAVAMVMTLAFSSATFLVALFLIDLAVESDIALVIYVVLNIVEALLLFWVYGGAHFVTCGGWGLHEEAVAQRSAEASAEYDENPSSSADVNSELRTDEPAMEVYGGAFDPSGTPSVIEEPGAEARAEDSATSV